LYIFISHFFTVHWLHLLNKNVSCFLHLAFMKREKKKFLFIYIFIYPPFMFYNIYNPKWWWKTILWKLLFFYFFPSFLQCNFFKVEVKKKLLLREAKNEFVKKKFHFLSSYAKKRKKKDNFLMSVSYTQKIPLGYSDLHTVSFVIIFG